MPRISLSLRTANHLAAQMTEVLTPAELVVLVLQSGRDIDNIIPEAIHEMKVRAVLRDAQSKGWLPDLCNAVLARRGHYGPMLSAACANAADEWASLMATMAILSPDTPHAALMLFNGAPFADRTIQRQDLQRLLQFQGRRVYVVRGDVATGKSHLATFVSHLVDSTPDVEHAPIDFAEMNGLVGARELALKIAMRMNLDRDSLTTDDLAQDARLAEKLCDWLVGQSKAFRQQQIHWVVTIDSVSSPNVGPGAQELIERLVVAVGKGELVNTALVLIGLTGAVPPVAAANVREQDLPHLTPLEIRSHIEQFANVMGKTLPVETLDRIHTRVMEGLTPPYGHDGMRRLRKQLELLPELIA